MQEDSITLSVLWDAIDRHIAKAPPPYREYARQGEAWSRALGEYCEQAIPKGCPETAAATMLRLEAQLKKHFEVTYVNPVCPGCGVQHNPEAKGCYLPKHGILYVCPDDPRRMFSTMAHETAHAFICATPAEKHLSRESQELIAEATATVVLDRYGLDNTEQASAYVAPYVLLGDLNQRKYGPVCLALAEKIKEMIDE